MAAAISDRATDEVLEALTRYRRGLGIADSPSVMLDEPQTPDIVRSQSSHVSKKLVYLFFIFSSVSIKQKKKSKKKKN